MTEQEKAAFDALKANVSKLTLDITQLETTVNALKSGLSKIK